MRIFLFFISLTYFTFLIPSKIKPQNINNDTVITLNNNIYGNIKIKLYGKTPLHKKNFLNSIKNGIVSYKVIPNTLVSFRFDNTDTTKIPQEIIPQSISKKGSIIAVNIPSNTNYTSATEFFIIIGKKYSIEDINNIAYRKNKKYSQQQIDTYLNIGGLPEFDDNYTIFGEIIEGLDIISKLPSENIENIKFTTIKD